MPLLAVNSHYRTLLKSTMLFARQDLIAKVILHLSTVANVSPPKSV